MTIENETQANFAIKHAENTTDRIAEHLLNAIIKTLVQHGVEYNGHKEIKQLGTVKIDPDDNWRLLFDVKSPDETFDHVEFKVTKCGWGRSI